MMNISRNKYRFITFVISLLCLFGTTVFLLIIWRDIPGVVPGHYNFAGEVDGTTGKISLIILLAVGWIIFIGMTVLAKFPQIWNTCVTITRENRKRVYKILGEMLSTVRLMMALIFSVTVVQSTTIVALSKVFFPGIVIVFFCTGVIFIVKLIRAR